MNDGSKKSAGLARRDLFGMAAAIAAAAVSPAEAKPRAAKWTPGGPVTEAGAPVVTKVVETTSGKVQGLVNNTVHSFKGIRYGAAPVGALRWMPPQKPEPSKVILDCSDFGAPAMQMATGATAAPVTDFGMQMSRAF